MSGSPTDVVVGYDGSPDAQAALDWAIREAASRHLGIRVVFAEPELSGLEGAALTLSEEPGGPPALPPQGPALVAQAAEMVARAGVPVHTIATDGSPASLLVNQSMDAHMCVIGSRGMGSVSSAILGSTVSHVAAHAHCPVIVVQAQGNVDGPVVVGIDGSAESEETLGWAIDHASRHGLAVEVLHTYSIPVYPGVVPYVPPVEITQATADYEERVAHEALAGWADRYPDVQITTRVAHGRPAQALIQATERASLTVVGSHGRGAFLGMLLGSTSQALLHHAKGSVAVLRHRRNA